MMNNYSTIEELVEHIKDEDVSYRNLHKNIHIRKGDRIIKVPAVDILNKYQPILDKIVVGLYMTDEQFAKYRYKPKMLSLDLYDTTELWFTLLSLNSMTSVIEFDKQNIMIYDPEQFEDYINEIMILENILE